MKPSGNSNFPTTHWTLVQTIGSGDGDASEKALGKICRRYWYPVYAFLRRSGRNEEDAEDLTQAFFEKLISDNILEEMEPEGGSGKLRSFLLAVLKHMLVDESRYQRADKRGGGIPDFSLDQMEAEQRYRYEPVDTDDPEKVYLRAWALNLVETTRKKLRDIFATKDRAALFEELDPYLFSEDDTAPYATLAERLESTEGAVRLLVHRTRAKFRAELQKEVANTLADAADVEAEMDWLKETLRQAAH